MRKENAITDLLLEEIIEGVVPLAYAIGFAMAYYGPNGNLMGNVSSDLWAYNKVEDVARLFYIQLLLFGVDCFSVALNMLILKQFGKVDLINELSKLMKKYWIFLALQLANTINVYFVMNDINQATDLTGKFEWITEEGRLRLIYNATDLSDFEKSKLIPNMTFT